MKTLILNTRAAANCEGVSRRDMLKVGALSFFGLSLPQFLAMRSAAAAGPAAPRRKRSSCSGARAAPATWTRSIRSRTRRREVRGEFKAIGTNVPGIQLSRAPAEHREGDGQDRPRPLPHLQHRGARAGQPVPDDRLQAAARRWNTPATARWSRRSWGSRNSIPPYIAVPEVARAGQAGFIGARLQRRSTCRTPPRANYRVQDVNLPGGRGPRPAARRRELLRSA